MQIGVPKERKRDERRVALTPEQARALVGEGHGVWVEQGAAEAVGWPDGDYARAGARVVAQGEVYEDDGPVYVEAPPVYYGPRPYYYGYGPYYRGWGGGWHHRRW